MDWRGRFGHPCPPTRWDGFIADALGSIRALVNETGHIVQSYQYDSFGNITILDAEGNLILQNKAIPNPYTFTAREYDPESGLYYYRARYYDPRLGRFLQEDPVKGFALFPQSFNLYPYCRNNPINLIDPYGLFTWPYTWKGWVGLTGMGAGTVLMFSGVGTPAGLIIFGAGTVFTVWDLVEGYYQAKKCVKGELLDAYKKRIEKLKDACGVSAKELQEMNFIRPNEELKSLGLTDQDLRDLGLLDTNEEYPKSKK